MLTPCSVSTGMDHLTSLPYPITFDRFVGGWEEEVITCKTNAAKGLDY
jgi:hypothetical protein